MQRLLAGHAASGLRRSPRRRLPLDMITRQAGPSPRVLAPAISIMPSSTQHRRRYHVRTRGKTATRRPRAAYFSTESPEPPKKKKKPGVIERVRRVLLTLFGANDDTPKGIQERKDAYWIVLAVAHRRLRLEHQGRLLQQSPNGSATASSKAPGAVEWQDEPRELLKDLMDEAVTGLDDNTDIGKMPLKRLRGEVQRLLEPQVIRLLAAARDANDGMSEENDDYIFDKEEEREYRDVLLQEYEDVCRLLQDWEGTDEADRGRRRTSDPSPYYEVKKAGIETVLSHFDWWPEDSSACANESDLDDEDYEDEFGFAPNKSDADLVGAMRYYHARNLVRSALVRRAPARGKRSDDKEKDNQMPFGFHSLLPLRSTIPSAGRGVFVDGFAPAGTLLAFIPGRVWPKEYLVSTSLQTQAHFDKDPRHQLSMRYDDVLIDSRQSPYTVVKNLWTLGHIFNHPPAPLTEIPSAVDTSSKEQSDSEVDGKSDNNVAHLQGPNCVTVSIDFTNQMLESNSLQDYLPNEYEHPPTSWAKNALDQEEVVMHGMGLVALRDLKDEELFYDYRLSPDNNKKGGKGYPGWYYVWDEEAISNRWDTDDS